MGQLTYWLSPYCIVLRTTYRWLRRQGTLRRPEMLQGVSLVLPVLLDKTAETNSRVKVSCTAPFSCMHPPFWLKFTICSARK